jgi:preprotein translocase subunit SecD
MGGTGQISGAYTVEQASDMAIQLRSGELPGKLMLIEQR